MGDIKAEHFSKAVLLLLEETFVKNNGLFLDTDENLFVTLETISAEEASIPVGGKCATLAAQVKHTAFFLQFLEQALREQKMPEADWDEIWRTESTVSKDEWEAIKKECRASYELVVQLVKDTPHWPSEQEMAEAMSLIAHSAYHLGEIRQAMCTIKGD